MIAQNLYEHRRVCARNAWRTSIHVQRTYAAYYDVEMPYFTVQRKRPPSVLCTVQSWADSEAIRSDEIDRIVQEEVIELATIERAGHLVLAQRKDASLRLWLDYRELNVVLICVLSPLTE